MDQLFVNERLPSPSPSPSGSIHSGVERPVEPTTTNPSGRHGKQPETSRPDDGPELSYAEYRARRKSSLAARRDVDQDPRELLRSGSELDGERSTHRGQYNGGRRPTLSSRSTEERRDVPTAVTNQGLLWDGSDPTPQQQTSNNDLYTTEDGNEIYRGGLQRSPERRSDSDQLPTPRRYSRPSKPYPYAGSNHQNDLLLNRSDSQSPGDVSGRIFERETPSPEVVVPRWQPDAEVTFCPICKTQFSFFVRKHHCRKCGRVVCNACSPHRITIPHQYIVQPPTDSTSATSRPSVDAARARSSVIVESLGGGERVRLCNPCVPDPNIAPPQTRSDGQPIPGHSRSQSTVPFSPTRRGDLDIPTYRARDGGRDSGIDAQVARDRYWAATSSPGIRHPGLVLHGPRSDSLVRPDGLESRSRSSTVGSSRAISQAIHSNPRQDSSASFARSYHASSPHSQAHLSRPLPSTPHHQQRHTTHRRRIREEDQCWLCFRELPSRDLPNSEELRSAHVMACVEAATLRASGSPSRTTASSPAPPPPSTLPSQQVQPPPRQTLPTTPALVPPTSQSSRPTLPPNSTPESRMLARERQHAAVVLGQSSSGPSSASAMTRVIPYIASEKDGIDDAECMICMEEFEVGQEMGRLECFCRFHLHCIKGWFERKAGKCPVHGGDFF